MNYERQKIPRQSLTGISLEPLRQAFLLNLVCDPNAPVQKLKRIVTSGAQQNLPQGVDSQFDTVWWTLGDSVMERESDPFKVLVTN